MRELERNNVAAALVSSIGERHEPRLSADTVRECNRTVAGLAKEEPGRIRWLAYLNPQIAGWKYELRRCLEEGAVGIKLWISLKDEKGGMGRASEFLSEAGRLGLPVLIHTYNRTWPDERTAGEINIEEFACLAGENPGTTMIAAHAGGGGWRMSMGVLRGRLKNALLEISGSYPALDMVESLAGEVGADRVLFGSDMPGRGLPSQIAKVVLSWLSASDKRKILVENAARIFRLDIPRVETPAGLRKKDGLPDFSEEHFIFCGRWPFFETHCESPAELDGVLKEEGIKKGYTGDLGSLFAADLESANRRFVEKAKAFKRVLPLAVLDPRAHNWPSLLRNLPADASGGLVSPFMHNWRLDDSAFSPFFERCAREGIDTAGLENILSVYGPDGLVVGREYPFRHPGEVPFAAERG